jgi:hypothetical protein
MMNQATTDEPQMGGTPVSASGPFPAGNADNADATGTPPSVTPDNANTAGLAAKDEPALAAVLKLKAAAYVPPFASFVRGLGISDDSLGVGRYLSIPAEVFKLMMASLIKQGFFDERWYLETYPDVAQAIRNGRLKSALDHYAFTGYYEGRSPGPKPIDQAWYLEQNKDVEEAITLQDVVDAQEHYNQNGYFEGRAASAGEAPDVDAWANVLRLY